MDELMDDVSDTNQLLTEILQELKKANTAERGSVSSVKITLQRGTVDVGVHAYTGSDITEPERMAIASYRRTLEALNQEGVDAFAKTLELVRAGAKS